MRAVVVRSADESLVTVAVERPAPADGEILIEVAAAGVNRADVVQRRGAYRLPADASPILGLECAGTVVATGADVTRWSVGDGVCALLSEGGYGEYVAAPACLALPVPRGLSLLEAAALPEATATVWANLVSLGELGPGDTVLIHGGASGIGTTAIQVAFAFGARVLTTVGDDDKAAVCRALGAETIVHRTEDFVERSRELTGGRGVDLILDIVGEDYLARNLEALAPEGRLVVIGLLSGSDGRVNLRDILSKRARLTGSLLRSRTIEQKAEIIRGVARDLWPLIEDGRVVPVLDQTYALEDAMAAHHRMEASRHVGKIMLVP